MLIIARTPNKRLYIGDEIQIKVIKVEGDTVSLGVNAPKNIRIVRSEQDRRSFDEGSIASVTEALKKTCRG
ncbi:carbon storage regulator [Pseudomonas sp. TH34]|uniref:carbon storage regulator n=1 Tax=Pseudomonas sp. TH34 TaxID=2796399 RepID=UPI001914C77B|nr:carbon storage regulator [Pseudomonas sp. TH34]